MDKSFFSKKNYLGLAVGAVVLIIGFILLGQGPAVNPISLSVAPVLLTIAYFIIIPWAILKRNDKKEVEAYNLQEDKGV